MKQTGTKFDSIVVGLGKTGISCIRYLAGKGQLLAVIDSRDQPPELGTLRKEFSDIPFIPGPFDTQLLASAKTLVVSPGVSLNEPAIRDARKNGVEVTGDIELFARQASAPVVAVTGSNGKSTVVTLITGMIRQAGHRVEPGGNIGIPALSLLNGPDPDFYVLELSSFQLETTSTLNAKVSVVLNISADHMDRYKSMDEYVAAKKKIYTGDGCMVINRDDEYLSGMVDKERNAIYFTLNEPAPGEFGIKRINDVEWVCYGNEQILPVSEILIRGRHNISNALAALALGYAIGLDRAAMIQVLKKFKGLPHRCEWVATIRGVDWINDSKGTNPGASCAAIEGLASGENIVLVAGGDGKGADFTGLARSAAGRVRCAILIGRDAKRIADALDKRIDVYHAISMDAAVALAGRVAGKGDRVLLSPACASLDMFSDYQERGTVFRNAVLKYQAEAERNG